MRLHSAPCLKEQSVTGKDSPYQGLPVPGYMPQSPTAVGLVSSHKFYEEQLLRHLDNLAQNDQIDQRWLAIGRTGIEQAFMAINRAVFQPSRVKLPEDLNDDIEKPERAGPPPYAAA